MQVNSLLNILYVADCEEVEARRRGNCRHKVVQRTLVGRFEG